METIYRPIESRFRHDNFEFFLLARQGDVALFAKKTWGLRHVSFEVVIVRKHEAKTLPSGKSYPPREAMPKSEEWGTYGWSPYDWPRAWEKFDLKVKELGFESSPKLVWEEANLFAHHTEWFVEGIGFDDEAWKSLDQKLRNLPVAHIMLPQ